MAVTGFWKKNYKISFMGTVRTFICHKIVVEHQSTVLKYVWKALV